MKLEKTDWLVYELLEKCPLNNKRIAKELDRNQTAISRSLRRLREMNMVGFQRCLDRRVKLYVTLSKSVHKKEE